MACGVAACNQILGNGDFEVDRSDGGGPDATSNEDGQTIANPADVTVPDSTTPPSDAGADAEGGATGYPDASRFPDAATVWQPAAGGNGHGYLVIVSDASVTWETANAVAADAGGHLATITSGDENQLLTELAVDAGGWATDYGPWLGGFQPAGSYEPDGGWTWVTNEPFGYTNWKPGEPNNDGDENNLQFYGTPTDPTWDGTWNDANDADGNISSFIIEFE